ncbi:hypothetical protein J7L68_06295 [bacterium]|nr:hypothetical protein [bacterium]
MKKLLLLSMLAIMLTASWGAVDLTMDASTTQEADVIINAQMQTLKWVMSRVSVFDAVGGRTDVGTVAGAVSTDSLLYDYCTAGDLHPLDSMTICVEIGNIGGVTIDMTQTTTIDNAGGEAWTVNVGGVGSSDLAGTEDEFIFVGAMKDYLAAPVATSIGPGDFVAADDMPTGGAEDIDGTHIGHAVTLANANGLNLVAGDPGNLDDTTPADGQADWVNFYVKYVNPLSSTCVGAAPVCHTIVVQLTATPSAAD